MQSATFPFTAIIGQDLMKMALILNVIDPKIGGVLLTGQQGTGKSTAVRSLAEILPEIDVNHHCQFQCDPRDKENLCEYCATSPQDLFTKRINLVNLPLGSTEEMVIGSLDIEKIIRDGKRAILPGLFAKAHRGILYVDEINLLQDHLVDILLDVSASGVNIIEREGISLSHPSSFVLVGSMNPEEGELRPQISDRLGLEVQIFAPDSLEIRAEITQRVLNFSDEPEKFRSIYTKEQNDLRNQITQAKQIIQTIQIPEILFTFTADLILKLGLYSQRADITFIRCARAIAAFHQHHKISGDDLKEALVLVFQHRVKRFQENISPEILFHTFEEVIGKYADLMK